LAAWPFRPWRRPSAIIFKCSAEYTWSEIAVKILVPVKRVPDPATTIRILPDGSGIATDNVKWVINPFDEIALEEALRIKEKQGGGDVVLLSIGQQTWQEQLRTGLAMGADRAILVRADQPLDSLAIARVMAKVVGDEKPDLVIIGKQAIDDDSNQVGQMLAEMLGWPQATFASKVEIAGTKCTVVREVDGGLETIAFDLPAVITTDLRLNEPRYASLPGIMKARKKELKEIPADSLGVDLAPKLKIKALAAPPKRQAGRKVGSVEELVGLLHSEAKVI
jgi:electron transfer flavoprotein beta subunit